LASSTLYLANGKIREEIAVLFALVLVSATLVAWAIGRRSASTQDHARRGMAAAMILAGAAHLVGPEPFVQHLPEWVPAREPLVHLSGLAEMALGTALVAVPNRREAVGRLLALFFLAVWPANIYVAVASVEVAGQPGGAYPWIRLPFQVLFIAWALWSTRPTHAEPPRAGDATVAATPS
jgi:uncharacterized membrane protein